LIGPGILGLCQNRQKKNQHYRFKVFHIAVVYFQNKIYYWKA